MAIDIITGFEAASREQLDKRSGPYSSVAAALAALDTNNRAMGMPIYVIDDQSPEDATNAIWTSGNVKTYHFNGGIDDDDLVLVSSDIDLSSYTQVNEDEEITGEWVFKSGIVFDSGTYKTKVQENSSIASDITVELPAAAGTFALTSQIPDLSGYGNTTADETVIGTWSFDNQIIAEGGVGGSSIDQTGTGTVSVTSGSTTVTGSGTYFTFFEVGDYILINDELKKIASISTDSSLEADSTYSTTVSDVNFYFEGNVLEVLNFDGDTVATFNRYGQLGGLLKIDPTYLTFDAGISNDNGYAYGSFLFGSLNTITTSVAYYSGALGYDNEITSAYSYAMGTYNRVSGQQGISLGQGSHSDQEVSYTFGQAAYSNTYGGLAVGRANTEYSATSLNSDDGRVFIVGNGIVESNNSVTSRSDALIVYQSGIITAPSLTTSMIDSSTYDTVIITREHLDNYGRLSDDETITGEWTFSGNVELSENSSINLGINDGGGGDSKISWGYDNYIVYDANVDDELVVKSGTGINLIADSDQTFAFSGGTNVFRFLAPSGDGNAALYLYSRDTTYGATIIPSTLTGNVTYTFPDATGTVALTSDLSDLTDKSADETIDANWAFENKTIFEDGIEIYDNGGTYTGSIVANSTATPSASYNVELPSKGGVMLLDTDLSEDKTISGDWTFEGTVKYKVFTYSELPSASGNAGVEAYISDGSYTSTRSVQTGGGSDFVKVYCDGTDWYNF